VTLFYGIVDTARLTLCYCNAGHDNPILLRRSGEIRRLETGGVVLSILESFPYEEESVQLEEGDVLVMYSDGVAEAVNDRDELFGDDRLIEVVRAHRNGTAAEIIDTIVGAVTSHAGAVAQADDITVVVMKATRD
jgi:sigma-B regulation protein RsbU (phosphoserine phosphatase)